MHKSAFFVNCFFLIQKHFLQCLSTFKHMICVFHKQKAESQNVAEDQFNRRRSVLCEVIIFWKLGLFCTWFDNHSRAQGRHFKSKAAKKKTSSVLLLSKTSGLWWCCTNQWTFHFQPGNVHFRGFSPPETNSVYNLVDVNNQQLD